MTTSPKYDLISSESSSAILDEGVITKIEFSEVAFAIIKDRSELIQIRDSPDWGVGMAAPWKLLSRSNFHLLISTPKAPHPIWMGVTGGNYIQVFNWIRPMLKTCND